MIFDGKEISMPPPKKNDISFISKKNKENKNLSQISNSLKSDKDDVVSNLM